MYHSLVLAWLNEIVDWTELGYYRLINYSIINRDFLADYSSYSFPIPLYFVLGPYQVNVKERDVSAVESRYQNVMKGGRWMPEDCRAKQKVRFTSIWSKWSCA